MCRVQIQRSMTTIDWSTNGRPSNELTAGTDAPIMGASIGVQCVSIGKEGNTGFYLTQQAVGLILNRQHEDARSYGMIRKRGVTRTHVRHKCAVNTMLKQHRQHSQKRSEANWKGEAGIWSMMVYLYVEEVNSSLILQSTYWLWSSSRPEVFSLEDQTQKQLPDSLWTLKIMT